jgi:hypothetical protein
MVLDQEVEEVLLERLNINEELAFVEICPRRLLLIAGGPTWVLIMPWADVLLEAPWVLQQEETVLNLACLFVLQFECAE